MTPYDMLCKRLRAVVQADHEMSKITQELFELASQGQDLCNDMTVDQQDSRRVASASNALDVVTRDLADALLLTNRARAILLVTMTSLRTTRSEP